MYKGYCTPGKMLKQGRDTIPYCTTVITVHIVQTPDDHITTTPNKLDCSNEGEGNDGQSRKNTETRHNGPHYTHGYIDNSSK